MLGQSTHQVMDPPTHVNASVLAEIHSTLLQAAARLYSIGYKDESDSVLATTKILSTHIELISNEQP
jgi:hypothetical protein